MRGTLHKTESGWQVWYHAKDDLFYGNTGVRILPLLSGDELGLFIQDTDSKNEGKEVEFEIVEFPVPPTNGPVSNSISIYAKLVDKATRPITETDAYRTRLVQLREQAWEEIIREFYRDAQKVPIGAPPLMIECWLAENYNPPTKKQN
jgi:hypothetical protein